MRVLQIQLDTIMGGIESFLFNVYSHIDREKVQFDFIEYGSEERDFNKKFEKLGGRIYTLPNRIKFPLLAEKELKNIIRKNNYKIVHIHKNSLSDTSAIRICQKLNVPTIVIHSHNSSRDNKIIVMLHKLNKKVIKLDNCIKLACSDKAGNWLFNKGDNIKIINNGIELQRFIYNEEIRKKVREKLTIEAEYVIGNVGRITEQKNPQFLIELLHKINKKQFNIKLLLVGDGELLDNTKKLVRDLGESENVIFTGKVDKPEEYYQAMDLFVMPSYYEGFPIAALEAQASGLPCILSNKITNEIKVTENVEFLDLENELDWKELIEKMYNKKEKRENKFSVLKEQGYDIKDIADFFQDFYRECEKGEYKCGKKFNKM